MDRDVGVDVGEERSRAARDADDAPCGTSQLIAALGIEQWANERERATDTKSARTMCRANAIIWLQYIVLYSDSDSDSKVQSIRKCNRLWRRRQEEEGCQQRISRLVCRVMSRPECVAVKYERESREGIWGWERKAHRCCEYSLRIGIDTEH